MYILKTILKWVIVALIFILIIALIVKFANKTEKAAKKVKEPVVNIVENQKEKETTIDDPGVAADSAQENLLYDSPDTASSNTIHIIIGSIILCVGANYIYKRRNIKENS